MRTRLILIAHAATAATKRAAFPNDEAAEPDSLAAVERLARRHSSQAVVVSSPSRAARQTAALLATACGATDEGVDEDLRDLDVGAWRGRRLVDLGDAAAAWVVDPHFSEHGGESIVALCGRIGVWLGHRLAEKGSRYAVTHAAVLRAAVVATLDAPASSFWRIDVPPLATLTLSSDGRRWTLRGLEHVVNVRDVSET